MNLQHRVINVVLVVHPAEPAETVVAGWLGHQNLLLLLAGLLHLHQVVVEVEIQILLDLDGVTFKHETRGEVILIAIEHWEGAGVHHLGLSSGLAAFPEAPGDDRKADGHLSGSVRGIEFLEREGEFFGLRILFCLLSLFLVALHIYYL